MAISTRERQGRINKVFDLLGPTPRVCIDFLSYPLQLALYDDGLENAISNVTIGENSRSYVKTQLISL